MVLESKQLIIRSLGESDIPAVLQVYQASRDFFDLQTAEKLSAELIQSELTRAKKSGGGFAGIFSRASYDLIGVIAFVPNHFQGQADYAWIDLLLIRPSDRSHGLGREAYQAIERHIFADPAVMRIGCALLPQFQPSLKFAEAMGFVRAGGPFKNKRGYGLYSFVKRRPASQQMADE